MKDTEKIVSETAEKETVEQVPPASPEQPRHGSHHHHHHHHHHRHHHSSRKSKKKNQQKKETFARFLRRNKKYLIYAAIMVVVAAAMLLLGAYLDRQGVWNKHDNGGTQSGQNGAETAVLQLAVPYFAEDVTIVGPAVTEYVNAAAEVSVKEVYDRYAPAQTRLDVGLPVKLSYELAELPEGVKVSSAKFLVSEDAELRAPRVYTAKEHQTAVEVYHLKTGTQYYYRVDLTFSDGNTASVGGSFRTADTPRVLTVDGVYNLRDIGGWKTTAGQTIKQGLLYRGCEVDGAVESQYTITSEGLNTMLTVLGIKTEMDLRAATDNVYGTDALGAGVKHTYYAAPMYSAIFDQPEKIRQIFADLADTSQYPVYLHCTYGQDRTGTICYLLEALLGVDETSLMKDYQLSGLHHGSVTIESMSEFIGRLKGMAGETMQQKVEGYLLSIGVTAEEIASIRSNFLE